MALHLDLKPVVLLLDGGTTIRVFDNTGTNDGTHNEDGWSDGTNGLDNPKQDEITEIIITATKGALTGTVTLTGSNLEKYLNQLVGYEISSADLFGSNYSQFEDGIYSIEVRASGSFINTTPVEWTAYQQIYQNFLWTLWSQIRTLTIDNMEIPVKDFREAITISLLNVLMDDVLYLCQFGDEDGANEVYDYLSSAVVGATDLTEIFKNLLNYD
jgi:hypothetical protein